MNKALKNRVEIINQDLSAAHYVKTEIGILPCDWKIVKLSDIAEKVTQSAGTDSYETVSISAGIGFVNQAKKFGKELSGKQYEKYNVLQKGDFSYNKGNSNKYPQGCIYRLKDRETAAVPNVFESFRIQSQCADFYDHLFVSGYLNKQLSKKINHGVRDDGLLNLTEKDFYSCLLPVPPLAEQKKISEILDHCDKLIKRCEAKVDEYKSLKKTCLSKIFPQNGSNVPELRFFGFKDTWEQRELGTITSSYSGGTPTVGKPEYYDGDIPFIRSGEINEEKTELFLSELGYNNSSAAMVEKGDILYALYGATSGEVSISKLKGAINQAILAIKPNEGYDSEFLMQWLRNQKENIISTYLQGGQGNLSGAIVKSLKIDITSYAEQKQIGTYFRTLDRLITLHQREVDEYTRFKKALMQLLFTGIIRVKV